MRELELEERKYRTHVRTLKIGYSVGVLMVAVGLFGLRVLHKGSLGYILIFGLLILGFTMSYHLDHED